MMVLLLVVAAFVIESGTLLVHWVLAVFDVQGEGLLILQRDSVPQTVIVFLLCISWSWVEIFVDLFTCLHLGEHVVDLVINFLLSLFR